MKYTLCFLLLLLCLSCQKQNTRPDNEPKVDVSKIYGKWDWIGSSGGIAGITYTPNSEHQTRMLTVTNDNNIYSYTNGNLITRKQFTVGKGKSYLTGDTAYIIHYIPDSFDDVILKAKNDTLVLANDGADGFTSGYVKHK